MITNKVLTGYHDVMPYYSKETMRWPGQLLDDVTYEYSGTHISLDTALHILSPPDRGIDKLYLRHAMVIRPNPVFRQ